MPKVLTFEASASRLRVADPAGTAMLAAIQWIHANPQTGMESKSTKLRASVCVPVGRPDTLKGNEQVGTPL